MIDLEGQKNVDLTKIFIALKDRYRNVFMHQYGDQVFFYRALGRKEYKQLVDEKRLNDIEKENVICEVCTVWPENYDFYECEAGLPAVLAEAIIKNSFLDTVESRINLLTYYRSEMYELDNQITCLIHEAFPQYDIEEIEEWDVEKATKYLSRAEWILQNLHGLHFVQGADQEPVEQSAPPTPRSAQPPPAPPSQPSVSDEPVRTNIRGGNKDKLSPEKIREMEEFARKFGINPFDDPVLSKGVEGINEGGSVDTTPVPLRPGW